MSKIKKPPQGVIEFFQNIPSAYVSDASKRLGIYHHHASGIHPLDPVKEVHIVGPAITMKCAPRLEGYKYLDSPYRHTEIVEKAELGDVIVIDGQGADYGFWGEMTTREAMQRKAAGIIIYGSTRDSARIRRLGLPVFCTGVTMNSYVLNYDVVGFNVPVNCGGAQVRAGDLIVADNDGVVTIPIERLDEVRNAVKEIKELETDLKNWIEERRPWKDIYEQIHWRKYRAEGQI